MSSSPASAVSSVGFVELSRLSGIGCLLQPGLFYLSIQKSMRVNINPLIKSCGTRPDSYRDVPAAETKFIGLQAAPAFGKGRRAGALFFARHLDSFVVT